MDVIDMETIQGLRDLQDDDPGVEPLLNQLIKIFLEISPKAIARVEEALAKGDTVGASKEAHGLKSSSGNLGATRLFSLCQRIEAASQKGELALAQSCVQELAPEYASAVNALNALIASPVKKAS